MRSVEIFVQNVSAEEVLSLNVGLDSRSENAFPFVWLVSKCLGMVWKARMDKKIRSVGTTRALLEAEIMLLRKTRFVDFSITISELVKIN